MLTPLASGRGVVLLACGFGLCAASALGIPSASAALDPPPELCWSAATATTIECNLAVAGDYCDSDRNVPLEGYLRDSLYNGTSCTLCTASEQTCADALDNDCDGRVDCEDPDCLANGSCTHNQWILSCGGALDGIHYGSYETDCFDGLDNEGDGHIDCQDRDCLYGTECPMLGDSDCVCTDFDGDGTIFEDWDDLALAMGTPDFAQAYRCAQIYAPFCIDAETRTFLEWLREKVYAGRIIAIHAEDANDPVKRYTGYYTRLQYYYDMRNRDAADLGPKAASFKADGVYEIEFFQVVATDPDIVNDFNTAEEVDQYLQPYFQEHVFGRETEFVYQQRPVSYETEFGPPSPCTHNPELACFDLDAMRSWSRALAGSDAVAMLHWGGKELTDGTQIYTGFTCQTCYYNQAKVAHWASRTLIAHEFGHDMGLPHPITARPYDLTQNPLHMLGTVGIMATMGYVYGGPERLAPLERYALEPDAGYADEGTFGPTWSAEALVCGQYTVELGACCHGTSGICDDDVPASVCLGDQDEWFEEASCNVIECLAHTGACCDHAVGSCIGLMTESECLEQAEQPEFFKDVWCWEISCAEHTGACCDHTLGLCIGVMTESECMSQTPPIQAEFFKGQTCADPDWATMCWEHTGACCLGWHCTDDVPESECESRKWWKDTPCSDPEVAEVCESQIPTVSEWGLIVTALLLLTTGTVLITRRRKTVG